MTVKTNKDLRKLNAVATMGSAMPSPGIMAKTKDDNKDWGIVNVSVCNMRVAPDYNAGMATQGLLGMPLRIIKEDNWLQVESPDGYISWVQPRSVFRVTREELSLWNAEPQLIVTAPFSVVYSQPKRDSQVVGDAVATNRLKYLGIRGAYYKVLFPDRRIGYIWKKDTDTIAHWRQKLRTDIVAIFRTARSFVGYPYMWGGMSPKGMDCSGFIRTVLLMHDIIIPRDASQMARKGKHINIDCNFTNLIPGDLLFFGKKASIMEPAKVSHVAFYMGHKRIIHSLGMVRIASLDPYDSDFDAYDYNRLLWAQRILPYINKVPDLFTTDNCDFYK